MPVWELWPFLQRSSASGLRSSVRPLAVIVLNSPLPGGTAMKKLWDTAGVRICADGGSNRLYDQFRGQLVPDVIIGDFDSVRPEVIQSFQSSKFGEPLRVIKCSDECNTDLDKCMLYAAYHYNHHPDEYSAAGHDEAAPLVAVAGSINYGGRLDHTFSIINSLLTATRGTSKESAGAYAMHLPNKFRPVLLDPDCLAMVLPAGDHKLQLGRTDCVRPERRYYAGVLPVEAPVRSCTTEGLRWNCEDYRLEFGGIISACNQINERTEMLRIVNSDPVLFTMTLTAEEASLQPSSPMGDDSDLKTLTNYSRLSFGTIFLGRKLHFLREVPPLTVGFYKYNERTEINRKLALAILPSLKVEVIVECVGSSVNYVDAVLLDFEGGLTEANNVFTTRPADTGSFARVLQRSKRACSWSDLQLKGDRPLMFSADRRTLYLSLSEDNTLALSRA
ncbi:cAMP-dependent protein kinase subunit [Perkinsus olseni]|uniref:cAMP-dependent protein kinase subunit n=1 Tax=Perkinsus olseni TaxID=32597 RepID=A0A7J6NTD7_PEROL|nr:cAMP-dependent protein kinase subunit [Perkinsus olseni]